MSHYEIDYSGLTGLELQAKALQDVVDYLGREMYAKLVAELRIEAPMPYKAFSFQLAVFVGIEGPPARALYNHIWPLAEKHEAVNE